MVIAVTIMSLVMMANPFSIVLKQLMAEFESGRGMVSMAPSISTAAGGIAGLFLGRLLLTHRPRVFMLWGSLIGGICLLLVSITGELWQVFALYFICGVAMTGVGALTMFTFLSKWFVKKFGTAVGINMTGGAVSSILIAPLIGFLAEHYGWRITYVFAGSLLLVVNIPLILFLMKDSPEVINQTPDGLPPELTIPIKNGQSSPATGAGRDIGKCLKNPALWATGLGFAMIAAGDMAVMQHEVSFLTDMNIPATLAATALGFTMAISGVSRLSSGWLADRLSSRYVAIMFLIIEICGMVILMHTKSMSQVWLFVIVYGLGTGASTTLLPMVLRDLFGSANFSMLFAILDIFYRGGAAIGVPMAGFIFDATGSYSLVFTIIIIFYILAAITIYLVFGINPHPFSKK